MTKVDIRSLTLEDDPLVLTLDEEFQLSRPVSETSGRKDTAEQFYRVLPKLRGVALAAEVEGKAVGYGIIAPRITAHGPDEVSNVRVLTHIAVLPEYQEKGVGSILLTRLVSKAKRAGLSMLTAHVPEHLMPFYEKHGWTVLGENEFVAWVEQPSVKLWEAAQKAGFGSDALGPRRKRSLLRYENKDDDPRYSRTAYIVLRPSEIIHLFPVPESPAPSSLRPHLMLAHLNKTNPAVYNALPEDVKQNAILALTEEIRTNPDASPEVVKTWLPMSP